MKVPQGIWVMRRPEFVPLCWIMQVRFENIEIPLLPSIKSMLE